MTATEFLENVLSANNLELLLAITSENAELDIENHTVSINFSYDKESLKTKLSEIQSTIETYIQENTSEEVNHSNSTAITDAKYLRRKFESVNSMLAL